MKILCNSCELGEANVLCCADEAVLCWACDEKVHAANKLASKHQRVPLVNSGTQKTKCDICQESTGFFFCLEDRALLCRNCDVAIHIVNSHVSQHQRFLITGVRVGLEPKEPVSSPCTKKAGSIERFEGTSSTSVFKKVAPAVTPLLSEEEEMIFGEGGGRGTLPESYVPFSGSKLAGTVPELSLDELLNLPDFSQNYGFVEPRSSKTTSNSGEYNWSPLYQAAAEEELGADQCLVRVPELTLPQTVTGLYWPENYQHSAFVPDINHASSPQFPNKRRRKFDQLQ